jgi:beta-galactosidase
MSKVTRRDVLRSGLILSGSTLLAYPGWAQTTGIISKAWDDQARPAIAPREKLLFDFGWRFTFGNAEDPSKDLDFGMGRNNFSKTGEFEFATAKFDDSKWRLLNLPHDWAVELPFVWDEELKSHGYKPLGRKYPDTSVGWYRRSFDVPAGDQGRKIEVMFDGAFRDALIFVNGCFIGRNDNGYTPFIFDISDFLLYGQKNYIVVRMDATYNDGWFYEGAGIYRHVWMIKQDKLHLGQWDSYVRTGMEGGAAVLELGTVVQNEGTQEESTAVRWTIRDGSGKTVATATAPAQQIGISESASYQAKAHIADPKLWSIESPTLYTTTVTVETSGKVRDAEEVDFGIRTVHFDAEQGFFLNGKRVPIQGTCNHQDHAGGARSPAIFSHGRAQVDGLKRSAHLAQHAYSRVGTGLRPHGHDDAVRDPHHERCAGSNQGADADDQTLPQLARHLLVVDGQRGVGTRAVADGCSHHGRYAACEQ